MGKIMSASSMWDSLYSVLSSASQFSTDIVSQKGFGLLGNSSAGCSLVLPPPLFSEFTEHSYQRSLQAGYQFQVEGYVPWHAVTGSTFAQVAKLIGDFVEVIRNDPTLGGSALKAQVTQAEVSSAPDGGIGYVPTDFGDYVGIKFTVEALEILS